MSAKTVSVRVAKGLLVAAVSFGSAALCAASADGSGTWSATRSMSTARTAHTATLLANGKVLVAGGFSSIQLPGLTSAELYDPRTGTWSATGSMVTPLGSPRATPLLDGKVLFTGGTSAEVYDPATGRWSATGGMTIRRGAHAATLLANGKVLITGGGFGPSSDSGYIASAELYDPETGRWNATAPAPSIYQNTATRLPNGQVLVVGGTDPVMGTSVGNAYLYEPASDSWRVTGSLTSPRTDHTATLLPNGKVLVAGGYQFPGAGVLATAEIYDPATGTWSATGSMTFPRFQHTATAMTSGKVLVFRDGEVGDVYDPATGTWSLTASMLTTRRSPTATALQNGKVLVVGGVGSTDYLATAEIYDDAPPPPSTRIEAGGNASFTDHLGRVWLADRGFTGGSTIDRGNIAIANTMDPRLYQTERYGMSAFAYDLPNGIYQVNLHFAETYTGVTDAGQRVFSVNVEGTALNDIDVFAQAGGRNKALVRSALVAVTDGQLNIKFTASILNPEINAIEIIPNGAVRIDAGSNTHFIDHNGNTWLADRTFTGGLVTDRGSIPIDFTIDPRIYQTERYGMTGFTYSVPNGTYQVNLHFAETYAGISGPGQRVFSANVEGALISNIDVMAEANGHNRAVIRSAVVDIADHKLNIGFAATVFNAEINGIEIIPIR